MNAKHLHKAIRSWVAANYGLAEAKNPSYNIKGLAAHLEEVLHLIPKPRVIKAIYDNGGHTLDRYTFVMEPVRPGLYMYLGTCSTGNNFSQWGECQRGRHLGKPVTWQSLDRRLQAHVAARLKTDEE